MNADAPIVKSFELKVYRGSQLRPEPDYQASGAGDGWLQYTRMRVPGFDGSISLNLEDFWRAALNGRHREYQDTVIGLETIFKFGRQMQLEEHFLAAVSIRYVE